MSEEQRRQVARKGAAALHASGKAGAFTPESGRAAREKQLEDTKNT